MTRDDSEQLAANKPAEATTESAAITAPRRRGFWQMSLRALLLLMAVCGVWTAHAVNLRRTKDLTRENTQLQSLVRDFVVQDLSQAAIIRESPQWFDEFRWRYYLPPGRYRIQLATRGIPSDRELAPGVASADLPDGQHLLSLEQVKDDDSWRIRVLLDDKPFLECTESKTWWDAKGSSGASPIDRLEQVSLDRPFELFRRRFMQPVGNGSMTSPQEPCNGVLVWIERAP